MAGGKARRMKKARARALVANNNGEESSGPPPSKRSRSVPQYNNNSIVTENKCFETYYRYAGVVPDDEYDVFMAALRRDLPSSFRISGREATRDEMKKHLNTYWYPIVEKALHALRECAARDTVTDAVAGALERLNVTNVQPPKPLPFVPDDVAFTWEASRVLLKKVTELGAFHRFLSAQSESGGIVRQEAVSMIPPLFMDIRPEHLVLDLCAAPGSKTTQLLEMLHEGLPEGGVPTGAVVANDRDRKRCYLLVHRTKVLYSPCLIVTNHDATAFPTMHLDRGNDPTRDGAPVFFDRILCDVPCSGDGTMRKNHDLWSKFDINAGSMLNKTQTKILIRGVQMLKVGGLLVYSTCSMNPVEDEAVVAAALRCYNGSLELVDASASAPGLRRRAGISKWRIMTNDLEWHDSAATVADEHAKKVHDNIFPPTAEEAGWMNLGRCMRVLPHDQDTGGFFIAVLRKIKSTQKRQLDVPEIWEELHGTAEAEEEEGMDIPSDADFFNIRKSFKNGGYPGMYAETPWYPVPENFPPVIEMYGHYGIKNSQLPITRFMTRSDSAPFTTLYMGSPWVVRLASNCRRRHRFVWAGLKTLRRTDIKAVVSSYRFSQDAADAVGSYCTSQIIRLDFNTLVKLLSTEIVPRSESSEMTQEDAATCKSGSCLFRYDASNAVNSNGNVEESMFGTSYFSGLLGESTLRMQVAVSERKLMLVFLLGGERAAESARAWDQHTAEVSEKMRAKIAAEKAASHESTAVISELVSNDNEANTINEASEEMNSS